MKKLLFLMITLWAFFYLNAQVALPHYDGIDYPAGQALQTQPGWTFLNTGDDILIEAGSLSYPVLQISTGNRIKFDGGGIDAAKAFTSQTSGTIYYSFLLNITNLGSLNNTNGGYFTGLADNSTNFGATIWVRANGTGFDIGLNPRTNTANIVWSIGPYQLNTTYFIVVSYEIVTGTSNDIVKLWINPTPGQAMPSSTLQATNTGTDLPSVQRILIRQDNASNTPFIEMDELRVGLNWSDVTPAAPTTIDWANLQWPPNGNINEGDNFTVYAQAWINGATQNPGATPGLECWIGYSTQNTNPDTWTNWVPAVFNVDVGNNDEFMANIGTAIQGGGTYFYASRWRYNGGQYYYGGLNNGFWNATTNPSGTLTVNGKPVISNVSNSIPRPSQNVTITADITDDGSVQTAKLYYSTTPNVTPGTGTDVVMNNTSGNTYTATIPGQPVNTTIYYIIVATDNTGLERTSIEYNYTVIENTAPQITNVLHTPGTPSSQQTVVVSANITDPDGTISSATLYYSTTTPVNPSTAPSVTMSVVSGNTYSGTIPIHPAGVTVYYLIVATDNENTSTTSNEYSYTVQSNALPVITNVLHNPTAPTSQDVVTVTADITDADGSIASATIYYSTTSPVDIQTAQSSQMTLQSGDTYRGFIPAFPNNTTVYYVIKAVDNENGGTISNEYSYTVTNPTATIQLAAFVPQENFDMIGIIFNSKVPQTAASNYKLYIGSSTILQPLNATIMGGITNDTVLLYFTKNSIPQDIILDTIVEEFYSASYVFYASVIPIKYTNTLNPDGTIQNNKTATFAGLVTADDEYNQVWIQDNCGPYNGVLIFSNQLKDYVNVGDQIYFIGSRTEYNGMTELIPSFVYDIEQNVEQPCVTEVASISQIDENIQSNTNPAEKWEGQLIKVTNVIVTEALSNYEYRATDGQYTIIIDDDAWYHYGNTTPFELNKNYNITGVVTFAYGKYKLNPRSAADIELVPVFDLSEFDAPTQQVPGGQFNIAEIVPQNLLPVLKFKIVDPGQDNLPTIVEYFRMRIEAENTIGFLNDIDSGVFILNNTPIWPSGYPQIVGNMLELYFGNNVFVVPNGQTYEMLIKILPKPSAAGKTMKVAVNTANSLAYQPTVSSSPLKQVDDDIISETFTFTYQPVATLQLNNGIVIYPNPVSSELYISTKAQKIEIFNNLGQNVKTEYNNSRINVNFLPTGVYTVYITTNEGQIVVSKFLKN